MKPLLFIINTKVIEVLQAATDNKNDERKKGKKINGSALAALAQEKADEEKEKKKIRDIELADQIAAFASTPI